MSLSDWPNYSAVIKYLSQDISCYDNLRSIFVIKRSSTKTQMETLTADSSKRSNFCLPNLAECDQIDLTKAFHGPSGNVINCVFVIGAGKLSVNGIHLISGFKRRFCQ